jgi:hypothetical protein
MLEALLTDGAEESGGRNVEVTSTTVVSAMQQIASELVNQYEIIYTLPEGVTPSDTILVSSKREGVTVHAPSRIAN